MASPPIRFRCFQCQKLLGISPSKAGTVVACPKCGAELLVPEPEPEAPELGVTLVLDGPQPSPSNFPDFGPEDIRVEPGAAGAWSPPAVIPAASPTVEAGDASIEAGFPTIQTGDTGSLRPEPSRRPWASRPIPEPPSPAPTPPIEALMFPPPTLDDAPAAIAPAPRVVEALPVAALAPTEALLGGRTATLRRDDVVLPRAAVLLWSFVAILAVAFAFGAGLLAGHYVWTAKVVARP